MRVRRWFAFCAMVAAAMNGTFALAETPADPAQPAAQGDPIEVRGKREIDKAIVAENIGQLVTRIPVFDVVPRFFQPLCLHVMGPDPDVAREIGARVMAVAYDVGLKRPKPKCRANALVLISNEPERLFDKLVQRRRDVVGVIDRDVHIRRIRDELKAGKPAITWNRTKFAVGGGIEYVENGIPFIQTAIPSRILGSVYRSKLLSVVVFDTNRLGTATPTQLADYAALHLLGTPKRRIDFEAVTANSILSLFADGPDLAPGELTAFDRAYLKGVYSVGRSGWRSKVTKAVLEAYEAQCADEDADCQFLVPAEAQTERGTATGAPG